MRSIVAVEAVKELGVINVFTGRIRIRDQQGSIASLIGWPPQDLDRAAFITVLGGVIDENIDQLGEVAFVGLDVQLGRNFGDQRFVVLLDQGPEVGGNGLNDRRGIELGDHHGRPFLQPGQSDQPVD